jgi:hypothetical protein
MIKQLKQIILAKKKKRILTLLLDDLALYCYTINFDIVIDLKWGVNNSAKGYVVIEQPFTRGNIDDRSYRGPGTTRSSDIRTFSVEKSKTITIHDMPWVVSDINGKEIVFKKTLRWSNTLEYKNAREFTITHELNHRRSDIEHLFAERIEEQKKLEVDMLPPDVRRDVTDNIVLYSQLINIHRQEIRKTVKQFESTESFKVVTHLTHQKMTFHANQRTLCESGEFLTFVPLCSNALSSRVKKIRKTYHTTTECGSVLLDIK